MFPRTLALPAFLTMLALVPGCSTGPQADEPAPGGGDDALGTGGSSGNGTNGPGGGNISVNPGSGGAGPGTVVVTIIETLPDGFTPADADKPETSKGGFKVLGPLADVPAPEGECANILRIVARDFQGSHADFENASDWNSFDVVDPIGDMRKPEKMDTGGPLHLDEWYQNLEGVNLPFAVDLWLEPVDGTFVYDSTAFFPLADHGYEDAYLFTTELHTNFEYKGGEIFTFRGDDDVFVYINGHLAVNLSGVHIAQEDSVDLDAEAANFGIEIGNVYTFDLFQAERQPSESNFRLETTLDFTGCGVILPVDIIR